MSHERPPRRTGLPRDVVKWLQTLDLSFHPKNARRDFSNGYLVAEIISHYLPRDFPIHSFVKDTSLCGKQRNWSQIEKFLQKKNLQLTKTFIDGTIHCKSGAAELLVQEVYTILTKRSIRDAQGPESDITDQELLPALAPSAGSIRNNQRITEITAEPDISTNQTKGEAVLQRHLEHQTAERVLHPELCSSSTPSGTAVSFKEIKVRQPVRRSQVKY